MVLIRNQFHPGPVLHRVAQTEAKLSDAAKADDGARRPAVRRSWGDSAKAARIAKLRSTGVLAHYNPVAVLARIDAACAKQGWARGKFAARIGQSGKFWDKLREQRLKVETFAKIEAVLAGIEARSSSALAESSWW